MDSDSILSIVILGLLVLTSAFFSASETAFSTMNRVRMKTMAAGGSAAAKRALDLGERYDNLLSTILIGNNVVNILSASLATVLFTKHFGDLGVTLSTAVMTVVVLIFGEISPKSLAKESPDRFAMFAAPPLRFLMALLTPLNFLFSQWKKLLSRLFQRKEETGMTEEELITIVDEAQQEGGIDEHEGELIRSAIEFNDLDVGDVFTPRVDVIAVDIEDSMEEIEAKFREYEFSRMPVYEDNIDKIVGILHEKDFYRARQAGAGDIRDAVQPAMFITEVMKISHLLRLLQKSKTHIAVVVDDFGGTQGIVTLEDVLEELVGEIWDEHDEEDEFFRREEDGSCLVAGGADYEDFAQIFGADGEYDGSTVGGWVVQQLGRLPEPGDCLDWRDLHIEVLRVEQRRVMEIRVSARPEDGEPLPEQ